MRWAALLALFLLSGFPVTGQTGSSNHSIKVTFTYNFDVTPACSSAVKRNCVKQFVVYDLSAGYPHRTVLLTIPVPAAAKGVVDGITGTTPVLLFETGKHLISVVAEDLSNQESDAKQCVAWVAIN
jgi:hypothetical protein